MTPPPPLYVLVNGASGQHTLAETRELLGRLFEEAGRQHEFVPLAAPGELLAAADQAAAQARATGGVLVAVGGDGTINALAAAALRHGCMLGVLPRGTFNYFGRVHGIAQDLEAAARALLRGHAEPVQVGLADGRVFLVNASLGLYPQLLQDRETFKNQFGRHRWVAMLSGLVTLFEWRRQLELEIEYRGERIVRTTPTLFVANNPLQMTQIGIDADTSRLVGDGRLVAIMVKPIGTWALLGLLLRGAFGKLGEAEQVESFAFESLMVRVRRTRKLKMATDGEVDVVAPPIRFAVSPTPLMLVLPRAEDKVAIE